MNQGGPEIWLGLASLLLVGAVFDTQKDRRRPLWLKLVARVGALVILTWLLNVATGSPLAPQYPAGRPGEQIWIDLIEIGWWMIGARVAVGLVLLFVTFENRPRETQIISDLLAGSIYVATALAVVNYVFKVPIGSLVATSGVVAVVAGLALQSTLSDVFSGIAVGLEHAYKPGDLLWVEGGIEGQILQIGWRSTQIATFHNSIAVIPNSVIAKSRLENRSAPTPTRGIALTLNINPDIDPLRCMAALRAAVRASRFPLPNPEPTVYCTGLQGDGVVYEISFVVRSSSEVLAARTETLALVYRHLRHAGISLSVSGVAPSPSPPTPTLAALMAESDAFGQLAPADRAALAEHFQPVTLKEDEQLYRQGEVPQSLILISAGTIKLAHSDENGGERVLSRANPGDTIGMIGLVADMESIVTATTLTPVRGYRLDKDGIAAVLRTHPELEASLEAQAQRGYEWFRCEAAMHEDDQNARPEVLVSRLRQFLQRLKA